MLVRDEPMASIVQEALEGYASGRFQIQAEVKRFLESHPEFPRDRSGEVRNQRVTDILTRPVYAGYVEAPDWGIPLRKGQHEPLISFETFKKIEERLNGKARVPARKDLNADFPLRGAVICGDCGTPLTACWSSGRNGRYPYYLCPKRGCASYGKSIRRDVIEGEFEALLKKLEPSQALYRVARAMFEDLWNHRLKAGEAKARALKAEQGRIERQVEQFLDRSRTPTCLRSSRPTKAVSGSLKKKRSWWRKESRAAVVRCAASTKHLEPPSSFSQVPGTYGLPSVWTTRERS
jgi:hypothetical protein